MNEPIRAGAEAPEPTPHIPRLQPGNFPGFASAARRNPDLILNSRGNESFQFGCGRTHGFAVCGDNDYVAQGGPGCNLQEFDRAISGDVDVSTTGAAGTIGQLSVDDLVNGTGLGVILQQFYNGGTPISGSMIFVDIVFPGGGGVPCTVALGEWMLTSFVENTAGVDYDLAWDTSIVFPDDIAPLCDDYLQLITDWQTCLIGAIPGGITPGPSVTATVTAVRTGLLSSSQNGIVKCNTDHEANIRFRPRQFFALRECGDWFDEVNWADQVSEDIVQQANTELSRLLEYDDGRGQNPSLISTAQNLTPGSAFGVPGTPVSIMRGFDLILGAFNAIGNGLGTFHGSSKIVPYASMFRQVMLDGNIYRGPLRLPYNPGPGFINAIPTVAGGQPDGSTTELDDVAWLYGITSPVEYRIGATDVFEVREYLANTKGALGEHKAVIRFNTCGVFAVRVATNDIQGTTVGI